MAPDHQGICSYCNAHGAAACDSTAEIEGGLERLQQEINSHLRPGRTYDCLVPVSGGKDSMLALLLTAKRLGYNVLAFNLDNGFRSAAAVDNIQRAVDLLGVDLHVESPPKETLFRLYRTFLLKAGEFCTPCNLLIWHAAQRLALRHRIPVVITGLSTHRSSAIRQISVSVRAIRRDLER